MGMMIDEIFKESNDIFILFVVQKHGSGIRHVYTLFLLFCFLWEIRPICSDETSGGGWWCPAPPRGLR